MARSRYEFIKIELRLFDDPRYFMLSEFDKNFYIEMIALAKRNRNHIKKDFKAIKAYLRTDREVSEVRASFYRLAGKFDNICQNKHNFWFSDWDERYHYVPDKLQNRGVEEDIDKDKEKDKEGSSKNKFIEGSGWLNPLKEKLKWEKHDKED